MRKFLIIIGLLLSLVWIQPIYSAPDIGTGMAGNIAGKSGYDASADEYSLSKTVGNYIKTALSLVGMIFLVLTVYAGFLWMTASGEEEKVAKSKKILSSAVIGLVITLSSYGITSFVVKNLKSSAGAGEDTSGGSGGNMSCCFYYTYTTYSAVVGSSKSWNVLFGEIAVSSGNCSGGACDSSTTLGQGERCWRFISNVDSCATTNAPAVTW